MAEYRPAGQMVGTLAPSSQKNPAGQSLTEEPSTGVPVAPEIPIKKIQQSIYIYSED